MNDFLTPLGWQKLEANLSKPLDDAGKALILDFLDFRLMNYRLEKIRPIKDKNKKVPTFHTVTLAKIYHDIVAFKETVQKLIPKAEIEALKEDIHLFTQLPSEAENTLKKTWFNLSLNAKVAINNELYLMTRTDTAKHLYHPTQYDIAASLALAKIPKPKQHQGRGNPLSEEKQYLYTCVFNLWRDLKETDFAIWHNTQHLTSSPLVAFTNALFIAEFECIKRYDPKTLFRPIKEQAISKNLKEFKDLIPYILKE